MATKQTDTLREMLERATPGEWESDSCEIYAADGLHLGSTLDGLMSLDDADANAKLIVAARNALPALLDRIASLETALKDMLEYASARMEELGDEPCNPEAGLCRECEQTGCLQMRIDFANAALTESPAP